MSKDKKFVKKTKEVETKVTTYYDDGSTDVSIQTTKRTCTDPLDEDC